MSVLGQCLRFVAAVLNAAADAEQRRPAQGNVSGLPDAQMQSLALLQQQQAYDLARDRQALLQQRLAGIRSLGIERRRADERYLQQSVNLISPDPICPRCGAHCCIC